MSSAISYISCIKSSQWVVERQCINLGEKSDKWRIKKKPEEREWVGEILYACMKFFNNKKKLKIKLPMYKTKHQLFSIYIGASRIN